MGRFWPQIQRTENDFIKLRKHLFVNSVLWNLYSLWEIRFVSHLLVLSVSTLCSVVNKWEVQGLPHSAAFSTALPERELFCGGECEAFVDCRLVYRSLSVWVEDTDDRALRKQYVAGKQKVSSFLQSWVKQADWARQRTVDPELGKGKWAITEKEERERQEKLE